MSATTTEIDIYYYSDNYNYTETYLNEFEASPKTSLIFGISYIVYCSITLIIYIRLLFIIIGDNNLNKLAAYRIILNYGISDAIGLVTWFIAGVSAIALSNFNPTFAKITGALYIFGVFSSSAFNLLLAFNRLIQNVFHERADEIFSRRLTNLYIVICWLSAMPILLMFFTSFLTVRFDPYFGTFGFSTPNNIRRAIFGTFANYFLLVAISIASILYVITIAYIIVQRESISKVEIRLTIQTMVDSFFRLSRYFYLEFFWESAAYTVFGTILSGWLALITDGLNAYVYVAFNK